MVFSWYSLTLPLISSKVALASDSFDGSPYGSLSKYTIHDSSSEGIPFSSKRCPLRRSTAPSFATTAIDLARTRSESPVPKVMMVLNSSNCESENADLMTSSKSWVISPEFDLMSPWANVAMNKASVSSCPCERSIPPLWGIPDWKLSATVGCCPCANAWNP